MNTQKATYRPLNDFFLLPYDEEDEQFVKLELLDLIRKKPLVLPEAEVGSEERPYAWAYILSSRGERETDTEGNKTSVRYLPKCSIANTPLASRINYNSIKLKEEPAIRVESPIIMGSSPSNIVRYEEQLLDRSLSPNSFKLLTRSDSPLGTWDHNIIDQEPLEMNYNFSIDSPKYDTEPPLMFRDLADPKSLNPNSSAALAIQVALWAQRGKSKMRDRYREVRSAIIKLAQRKKISTQIVREPDAPPTLPPYYLQGNVQMYSDDNIRRRMLLKQEDKLRHVIEHWWFATVKMKDKPDFISKITYLSLAMAIYSVMMPDDAGRTLDDARKNAEKDWRDDAEGGIVMNYAQFFEAIFELSDIWCETTKLNEYVMFLDVLFQKVYLDNTLPKILRKHINLKYIEELQGKILRAKPKPRPKVPVQKRSPRRRRRAKSQKEEAKPELENGTKETQDKEEKKDEEEQSTTNVTEVIQDGGVDEKAHSDSEVVEKVSKLEEEESTSETDSDSSDSDLDLPELNSQVKDDVRKLSPRRTRKKKSPRVDIFQELFKGRSTVRKFSVSDTSSEGKKEILPEDLLEPVEEPMIITRDKSRLEWIGMPKSAPSIPKRPRKLEIDVQSFSINNTSIQTARDKLKPHSLVANKNTRQVKTARESKRQQSINDRVTEVLNITNSGSSEKQQQIKQDILTKVYAEAIERYKNSDISQQQPVPNDEPTQSKPETKRQASSLQILFEQVNQLLKEDILADDSEDTKGQVTLEQFEPTPRNVEIEAIAEQDFFHQYFNANMLDPFDLEVFSEKDSSVISEEPEQSVAEENLSRIHIQEVVRQRAAIPKYDPSYLTKVPEYTLSRKKQKNLLLVAEEKSGKAIRSSWLPDMKKVGKPKVEEVKEPEKEKEIIVTKLELSKVRPKQTKYVPVLGSTTVNNGKATKTRF